MTHAIRTALATALLLAAAACTDLGASCDSMGGGAFSASGRGVGLMPRAVSNGQRCSAPDTAVAIPNLANLVIAVDAATLGTGDVPTDVGPAALGDFTVGGISTDDVAYSATAGPESGPGWVFTPTGETDGAYYESPAYTTPGSDDWEAGAVFEIAAAGTYNTQKIVSLNTTGGAITFLGTVNGYRNNGVNVAGPGEGAGEFIVMFSCSDGVNDIAYIYSNSGGDVINESGGSLGLANPGTVMRLMGDADYTPGTLAFAALWDSAGGGCTEADAHAFRDYAKARWPTAFP